MTDPRTHLEESATALGFELIGWDGDNGGLVGHGAEFVGSRPELSAYLLAWATCHDLKSDRAVPRSICVLRSYHEIVAGDVEITVRPQKVPFVGERIAVPDDVAPYFDILDIRVGNRSQFLQATPQSAALYAVRMDRTAALRVDDVLNVSITEPSLIEFGRPVQMEACQAAQDLAVWVRLKDGAPSTAFEMWILGRSPSTSNLFSSTQARAFMGAWQQIVGGRTP